jgi:REP element-mobilizing transposase RayT
MALPQHQALFLTWRTYGTWLPGDERGWIDERRNGFGEPMNLPDVRLEGAARGQMRSAPVEFTDPQRLAVDLPIREACEFRGWQIVALNVRTNHVHLVVGADEQPAKVLNVLKVRATTVLRAGRMVAEHRPIWARGGSRRVLWDDAALAAAVEYVLNGQ